MIGDEQAWRTLPNRSVVRHVHVCMCSLTVCMFDCVHVQFTVTEVTAVLLARFKSRGQWADIAMELGGRAVSAYKCVFNETVRLVHERWFASCMDLRRWADADCFGFAQAIHNRTQASPRVIGFLDGTFIQVCRPGGPYAHQRQLWSRYYKAHGYKFQSVMLPNGIMSSLHGPVAGRFSDSTMLARSSVLRELEELSARMAWHIALYGDSAYPRGPHLLRGLKRHMIHQQLQQDLQTAMNQSRTSVEWGFGAIEAQYPWMTAMLQKAKLSPIAVHWQTAALLTNCYACLTGGNVVSDFFGLRPPTLAQYLRDDE